jgi:hypothetical protein
MLSLCGLAGRHQLHPIKLRYAVEHYANVATRGRFQAWAIQHFASK